MFLAYQHMGNNWLIWYRDIRHGVFFYNDSHKEMSYTIRGIGLSTYLASSASTVTDKCRRSGPSTSTRNQSVVPHDLTPPRDSPTPCMRTWCPAVPSRGSLFCSYAGDRDDGWIDGRAEMQGDICGWLCPSSPSRRHECMATISGHFSGRYKWAGTRERLSWPVNEWAWAWAGLTRWQGPTDDRATRGGPHWNAWLFSWPLTLAPSQLGPPAPFPNKLM
jgi:hypothetical protein